MKRTNVPDGFQGLNHTVVEEVYPLDKLKSKETKNVFFLLFFSSFSLRTAATNTAETIFFLLFLQVPNLHFFNGNHRVPNPEQIPSGFHTISP